MMKFVLIICLLMICLSPFAAQAEGSRSIPLKFDIRRQQPPATTHQIPSHEQHQTLQHLRGQIQGLQVHFHPTAGTVHHLFSLSQRLTPPRQDDPIAIAQAFLNAQRALFRLQPRDLDDLAVVKNYRTQHNGVTHLVFKQFARKLEVFEGHIKVNIDRQGQILSVNGTYFPGSTASVDPTLSAADAVRIAASHMAPTLGVVPVLKTRPRGAEQLTTFYRGPFDQDITAKLVLFPGSGKTRLAWKIRLHWRARIAWYDTLVDAHTGEILFYHNLYQFDGPQGLVFDTHPDGGPQVLRPFAGDPVASPDTWLAPLPNMGTQGNNIITLPLIKGADQHFEFPFVNSYEREGLNAFDLVGQRLRFTPNEAGGYDAELLPLGFDGDLGANVTGDLSLGGLFPDADDGSVSVHLGFSFPFFGQPFRSAFLNANGFVAFGSDVLSALPSWVDLIERGPRIAALLGDLRPGVAAMAGTGGVFVKPIDDRVVMTWSEVPADAADGTNTVQLTLFDTGVIDIAFADVALNHTVVGLSLGSRELDLQPIDFSAETPLTGLRYGIAEKFPTRELDAATANLFYHHNVMHDHLYHLGFDEAAGNFQLDNFGRGGRDGDPVLVWPQHAGFNNAFFGTPEDGSPPFTGYAFFTAPPFRQADSAFDADVIYHEYTHGLTRRLVGNPFDIAVFFDIQSGAMSEGWSDIYAASLTGDPIIGEYVTGNSVVGIRGVNYAMSPLRYGDFGNRFGPVSELLAEVTEGIALDQTFIPKIHRDGEIWASALWDLRILLGRRPFEQLITDALKLTPANPSMLDGRDAILLADVAANDGANQETIWRVFAARGMGFSAWSRNGNATVVLQAFDKPSQPLVGDRETLFFDDMEMGVNGWSVTGTGGNDRPALWHQSARRGSTAWYYGQAETANYDTGTRNFGALTSPVITLPSFPEQHVLILEFDHFMRAQPNSLLADNGYVRVLDQATSIMTQVGCLVYDTAGFEHQQIDISRFAGRDIRIEFYFDPLNDVVNSAEGWYIDNVKVSQLVP